MIISATSSRSSKATDNSGGGVFSGYASTWEKDLDDDVVVKGAFAQTLSADFKAGGAGIPIDWQHKDGSPNDAGSGETLSPPWRMSMAC